MAYQVLDTNLLQSAIKAASAVTAAAVTAGSEDAVADPVGYMDDIADTLFQKLKVQADKDNEKLREEDAKNPPRQGGGGGQRRGGGGNVKGDPDGSLELTWGSFKGLTIADVYELSAEEAEEYGYTSGSGSKYVNWLSGNDKNKFAAAHAKAFLDAKRG